VIDTILAQRGHAKSWLKIIRRYRAALSTGKRRRGVRRGELIAARLRSEFGVSARTILGHEQWLRHARPDLRRLLFGDDPPTLATLPVAIVATARRRFDLVVAWEQYKPGAMANGKSVSAAAKRFLQLHGGVSASSLYNWCRNLRFEGIGGLIDMRSLRFFGPVKGTGP